MIRPLKSSDLINFLDFCSNKDPDFYITENNQRKYLTDWSVAKRVFNRCLKLGDKCYVSVEKGDIQGLLLITGFSDNFVRKYVAILTKHPKHISALFQYLNWKNLPNLFMKVKKTNQDLVKYNSKTQIYHPKYALKKAGFYIKGLRGTEVLLTTGENSNGT